MNNRRLSDGDIRQLVLELQRWADGELGSKLTWALLEQQTGFSRQALQAHLSIKSAYKAAKEALRGGLVKTRSEYSEEVSQMRAELIELKSQLKHYKDKEKEWQKRWQRMAYYIRMKGMSVLSVDRDVDNDEQLPSKKETAEILKLFDHPLPPTGRK